MNNLKLILKINFFILCIVGLIYSFCKEREQIKIYKEVADFRAEYISIQNDYIQVLEDSIGVLPCVEHERLDSILLSQL